MDHGDLESLGSGGRSAKPAIASPSIFFLVKGVMAVVSTSCSFHVEKRAVVPDGVIGPLELLAGYTGR
jgi:hypothetical protein